MAASLVVATPPAVAAASPAMVHASTTGNQDSRAIERDPADSLYRLAREALSSGSYDRAAKLFHQVGITYPQSALAPDAMYYEAFARYRVGGSTSMRSARDVLASLQTRFPDFGRRSDAATLATRICGELAQQGDASCAASISAQASSTAVRTTRPQAASGQCPSEDDDERVAALNALLQMDADRAEPILEKVLARRDACSTSLRRKAVFLVAQKASPQAADVLLRVAQTDPDADVREQAVFWISQVQGEHAVTVLSDILRKSPDIELRKKALFALSQSEGGTGARLLREYAGDASQPSELRETAIFWLGQQKDGNSNTQFLRDLYSKLTDETLKDKVLFSLSQGDTPDRARWLLQVAQKPSESTEMRKKALFLAGQAGASMEDLTRLYDTLPPGELREQMIFVFSQRREASALDKLISIARSDKDPESRKKALFWVGQSHDPRATKMLTEIIDK
jgi:HEAT repeat protein